MRGGDQNAGWISAWKTPKGVTPPEFAAHYEELSAEDTFHDMWDPRGAASPMKGDVDVTADMRRVQVKSANLNSRWRALESDDAVAVAAKAKEMALGENPGASDYERSLVIKWESTLPSYLHSTSRKLLTYDEIIADWNGPKALWQKYTTSFVAGNILEINNAPGKTFKMLDQKQRAIVANFMLSYLWPTGRPVQGNQYNVTFDAGPVVIRRLLDSIEVKNLITPQNVADSAATGFNAMKTTTYAFPNTGRVKSNTFTGPYVEIKYVNNGFGPLNPYGFSIDLDFKAIPGTAARPFKHTLQFSPKQNSGPSVNYLVTSILRVGTLAGYKGPIQPSDREKSTIIDIAPLVAALVANGYPTSFIQALLLDLKRIGDHEQIAAALTVPNTLFATIDILCCFMARFVRTPNAWSNNDSAEIWLHRFDTTDLNIFQQFLRYHVAFAQEQLARIKVLPKLVGAGVGDRGLADAVANFTANAAKVYYVTTSRWTAAVDPTIRGTISLPASIFPAGTSPDVHITDQDIQTRLVNSLTTHLLRIKLANTLQYATELVRQLSVVRSSMRTTDEQLAGLNGVFSELSNLSYMGELATTNFRTSMVPGLPDPTAKTTLVHSSGLNVTQMIAQIRAAFRSKELIGLCLTDKDIYPDTIFEGTTPQLRRGANNPTFNISKDMFDNFNSAFREFFGLIHPARNPSRADYEKKVNESLDKFFKKRDVILKSFYVPEGQASIADTLEQILDIPNDLTAVNKRAPALAMIINLQSYAAQVGLASNPAAEVALEQPVLEGGGQHGGANENPIIDRIELFKEICGMASAYVSSILSAVYTIGSATVPSAIDLVKTDLATPLVTKVGWLKSDPEACMSAFSDICLKWNTGLLNIQETTLDQYGTVYVPSNTDVFVTMLVSVLGRDVSSYVSTVASDAAASVAQSMAADPRAAVAGNDIWGQLLTSAEPAEVRVMILLTILDNWLRPEKQYKYLTDGLSPTLNLSGTPEWDALGRFFYPILGRINQRCTDVVPPPIPGAPPTQPTTVLSAADIRLLGLAASQYAPSAPPNMDMYGASTEQVAVVGTADPLPMAAASDAGWPGAAYLYYMSRQQASPSASSTTRSGLPYGAPRLGGRKTRRRGLPKLV